LEIYQSYRGVNLSNLTDYFSKEKGEWVVDEEKLNTRKRVPSQTNDGIALRFRNFDFGRRLRGVRFFLLLFSIIGNRADRLPFYY